MTSPLLPGEPPVDTAPTLDDLIRDSGLPRAEARRLLASLTVQPLTWFMAHGDDPADPNTATRFQTLAQLERAILYTRDSDSKVQAKDIIAVARRLEK